MSRLRKSDLGRMALSWTISSLALTTAAALLPGLSAESQWRYVAAAAIAGVYGVVIRPVLANVAAAIGWLTVVLISIVGQAVVMQLALLTVPGISVRSFWTAVLATWIAAGVGTLLTWVATAGTDTAFETALQRFTAKATVADPEVDGVVFIQLDGVPFPVAQWALQSGSMPTLRRWLDGGTHRLQEWTVQLPCTTPVSQQGILHGTCDGVPAFRWYDRELGRMLVANRPADAAVIESRATDGRGLLYDDGISVSNLFSGDAPRTQMTMSQVSLQRGSLETRRAFARFVIRPDGFARSMSRTVAEVVRERFQAARQRRRDVLPRVERSWTFAVLRSVSNGVLRDLNTAIISREMLRGTHSMYVDYVDFDEIAHHAGGYRVESLAVLSALDDVFATLERVAKTAPRRYHFVILSDHGQVQGAPFAERFGVDLSTLCTQLTQEKVEAAEQNVESWGRAESLLDDLGGEGGLSQRAAGRAATRMRDRTAPEEESGSQLMVLGSGNLGLVYVQEPERLTKEDLDGRWPDLLSGLAAHPGIGFVGVLSAEHGPLAIGANGVHRLDDGHVTGEDPLLPFGPHSPEMVRAAVRQPRAPDIYVNSMFDPSTLEVAAFEDLVGSHGGLGGAQDRGTLIAPVDLIDDAPITGAVELHQVLVGALTRLGHRRRQPAQAPADRVGTTGMGSP